MASVESLTTTSVGVLRIVGTIVFAVALPVFLVTSGVRWVALTESFYLGEFAKYRVSQTTRLSNEELRLVAGGFIDYFQSEPLPVRRGRDGEELRAVSPLDLTVQRPDGPLPLFNEREMAHMHDVHQLMRGVFLVWIVAGIALLVSVALIALPHLASAPLALARAGALGGGLAVLLIGAVGAAALLDFSQIFLRFHLVSFSNDLWLLDPRRDRLIQLFPQGYFMDAAYIIAVETVAVGALVLGISLAAWRALR